MGDQYEGQQAFSTVACLRSSPSFCYARTSGIADFIAVEPIGGLRMVKLSSLLLGLIVCVTACTATSGSPTLPDPSTLQVNQTTLAEVIARSGPPSVTTRMQDPASPSGYRTMAQWVYAKATSNPFSSTTSSSSVISLLFNSDNIYQGVFAQSSSTFNSSARPSF